MNKKILHTLLAVWLLMCFTSTVAAQVTIGSGAVPRDGAVLDLKENDKLGTDANSAKGLGLPRVKLVNKTTFLTSVTAPAEISKQQGMMVYNIDNTLDGAGVYTWDGGQWINNTRGTGGAVAGAEPAVFTITTMVAANQTGKLYKDSPVQWGEARQTVTVNVTKKGAYHIYTDKVDGIMMEASGLFEKIGNHNIELAVSGTPTSTTKKTKLTIVQPTASTAKNVEWVVNDDTRADIAVFTVAAIQAGQTGKMYVNIPIVGNSVLQQVNVTVSKLGAYEIRTNLVHGIQFVGSGVFDKIGSHSIYLVGKGTPTVAGEKTFTMSQPGTTSTLQFKWTPLAEPVITPPTEPLTPATFVVTHNSTAAVGTLYNGVDIVPGSVRYSVTATPSKLGAYQIKTTRVDGVQWEASGIFTKTGAQAIDLIATGCPTSAGAKAFVFEQYGTTVVSNFNVTVAATPTVAPPTEPLTQAVFTVTGFSTQFGVMYANTPIVGNSVLKYIQLNVTKVGAYEIRTNVINGVQFVASGVFEKTGTNAVYLTAQGTPTAAGTHNFPIVQPAVSVAQNFNAVTASPPAVVTNDGLAPATYTLTMEAGKEGYMYKGATIGWNKVRQAIKVKVTKAGAYHIITDKVNGIQWEASGIFESIGDKYIDLIASGTAVNGGTMNNTIVQPAASNTQKVTSIVMVNDGTGNTALFGYALKASAISVEESNPITVTLEHVMGTQPVGANKTVKWYVDGTEVSVANAALGITAVNANSLTISRTGRAKAAVFAMVLDVSKPGVYTTTSALNLTWTIPWTWGNAEQVGNNQVFVYAVSGKRFYDSQKSHPSSLWCQREHGPQATISTVHDVYSICRFMTSGEIWKQAGQNVGNIMLGVNYVGSILGVPQPFVATTFESKTATTYEQLAVAWSVSGGTSPIGHSAVTMNYVSKVNVMAITTLWFTKDISTADGNRIYYSECIKNSDRTKGSGWGIMSTTDSSDAGGVNGALANQGDTRYVTPGIRPLVFGCSVPIDTTTKR